MKLITSFLFLMLVSCAEPAPEELGDYVPIIVPEKKMIVINRHVQAGLECHGNYIAVGVDRLQPPRILCAAIDFVSN